MAEKEGKPYFLPKRDENLTREDVIAIVDAYINSPGGLRLKTGLQAVDGWAITASGQFTTSQQIISTLATGTKPLDVSSTTVCTNLNADQVDGYDLNQAVTTTSSPTFAAVTVTNGSTGTFTTVDSKTVTVTSGIITSIV